jgi:hypothetical protein
MGRTAHRLLDSVFDRQLEGDLSFPASVIDSILAQGDMPEVMSNQLVSKSLQSVLRIGEVPPMNA